MSRRIQIVQTKQKTFSQIYENFIHSKTVLGMSDIIIRNYRNILHSISKHLDIEMPFAELDKRTLENMIVSMRGAGLSHNIISTYVRAMRTFLSWCRSECFDLGLSIAKELVGNIIEKSWLN